MDFYLVWDLEGLGFEGFGVFASPWVQEISSFPRGFRVQVAAFLGIWVFKCLGFLVGRKKIE